MSIAVSRAPGTERVVSPLELFFDLVYVFERRSGAEQADLGISAG